jgi:dTDP-glucose 4,6-dehydratase
MWRQRHTFEEGLARTVQWYLGKTEWVESIRTGAYKEWIEKNYGDRN